jgi:cytochrome c peroxidase
MGQAHRTALIAKAGGLACAMALLFGAGATHSGEAPHDRAYWRAQYRRPVEIPFPESNPYSEAKSRLGRMLFFDPILSGSQVRSCATCHNPGLS